MLRRPRPWIFRRPPGPWAWPVAPWLPTAAEPSAPPPEAPPAPDDAGAADAAPPDDGAGTAAAPPADPGDTAPAEPEGELPASVWAGGRRVGVRWFRSPRPLGPDHALGAPAGGGVYLLLVGGSPVAAHFTRDFNRDLRDRLAAAGRRPTGLTAWYGRVDEALRLGQRAWRQIARGVRRAVGLPLQAPARRAGS